MAIDGSTLSLAESEENEAYFEGQVAKGDVRQGPPRARVVALISAVLVRWSISHSVATTTVNRISPSVC